jgi:kumamolisin
LTSIQDPSSGTYEHFLNATTLLPYLPTPGQKASVISFLTQRGFTVTEAASPLVIYASGTAAAVEEALGVHMNMYRDSAHTFFASDSDPTIPANFVGILNGIIGLDNYTVARPTETPCGVFSADCPQGIQVGYSLSSLYTSGFNGTGKKVAIIDEPGDPNIQAAVNNFTVQYSLANASVQVLTPNGQPVSYDPGWASETAMDVEAVHSVAPGAGIVLLYGNGGASDDIMNLVDYVANNTLAGVASNSWAFSCGGNADCSDTALDPSFVSSNDLRLTVDVSMGLTILFASGDNGAKPDRFQLGTEFPASDPNVLAIGATDLTLTGCSSTPPFNCSGYGSEDGAIISGGGYSGFFQEPVWQATNIGQKAGRAVPDVSMLGDNPGFWVYSTSSDHCGSLGVNSAGWFGCAGTSLSTPLWAGFLAVALQVKGGSSFGNVGPLLYQVANSPSYSSIFHDIKTGSNNGYTAGKGWDPVTGWGTPIANQLAQALKGSTATRVLTTTVSSGSGSVSPSCPSGCSVSVGGTVNVTANASPGWQFSGWSNQVGVSCSSNPCTFTMPNTAVTLAATFTPIPLGKILSQVFSASANSVWIIVPDYTAGQGSVMHSGSTKCGGVGVAFATDVYAATYMFGALANPQNEILDTNSVYISQGSSWCGEPSTATSEPVVAVAGPYVNEVVHYYEASTAPLYFDGGSSCIVRRDTGVKVDCSTGTATNDVFLMEVFTDQTGRTVFIIYGRQWVGTLAGYEYLVNSVSKNPSAYTHAWYVYSWQDAASGVSANSIPDPGDTYTQIAAGP